MEAVPNNPHETRRPEDDSPLTPLDGVSKLRDKIAAVICGVQIDGRLEDPCQPLCTWCCFQAVYIIDAIQSHEGKS